MDFNDPKLRMFLRLATEPDFLNPEYSGFAKMFGLEHIENLLQKLNPPLSLVEYIQEVANDNPPQRKQLIRYNTFIRRVLDGDC